MSRTLITLVEDRPGVLNRVTSLFRRRNFNIASLNVGRTEQPDVSRMTILMDSDFGDARLAEANLYKLVNVIDVQDVTNRPTVKREIALIKVKATPDQRAEVVNLASIFRGNIVDVAPDSVIVEMTGTADKIESLLELLRHWAYEKWCAQGRSPCCAAMRPGSATHQAQTAIIIKK